MRIQVSTMASTWRMPGTEVPKGTGSFTGLRNRGWKSSFQAVCPELLITAFGDTPQEARNALRQQVAEYLEDCDNLGALDEALIEAGFYFDGDVWMSSEVKQVEGPDIVIL